MADALGVPPTEVQDRYDRVIEGMEEEKRQRGEVGAGTPAAT